MKAKQLITEIKADLQDKSNQWSTELLLVKLQRAYISLQNDLPYFIASEAIAITEGTQAYRLKNRPIANISFTIDDIAQSFMSREFFYKKSPQNGYTFEGRELLLSHVPTSDSDGFVVYKYEKELENENCEIELPSEYFEALRLLCMKHIHEKPTRNTKERNLSTYYLNLYKEEVKDLKLSSNIRPINVRSNYIKV